MDEAAPQAAGGMTAAEIAQALDVLWALREDEYLIGCDDRGWWASRRSVADSSPPPTTVNRRHQWSC